MQEIDPNTPPIDDRVEWLARRVATVCAASLVYQAHGIVDANSASSSLLDIEIELHANSVMPIVRKKAEAWLKFLDDEFVKNMMRTN